MKPASYFENLKKIDTTTYTSELSSKLRHKQNNFNTYPTSVVISYVLLIAQKNKMHDITSLEEVLKKSKLDEMTKNIIVREYSKSLPTVLELLDSYSRDVLSSYILFNDDLLEKKLFTYPTTPDSILDLSSAILHISDTDSVLNLCSGIGSFFAHNAAQMLNYTGVEISGTAQFIATIRKTLINLDYELIQSDVLSYINSDKFDKGFSNYPFMMKFNSGDYKNNMFDKFNFSEMKRISSDWLFNARLIQNIKETGKAVGIMTNGATWNNIDKEIRKQFIEKGYIETVISLPPQLFEYTAIASSLIVLSFGNKKVNLVDASNFCKKGRRTNEFSAKDIKHIISLIGTETDFSTTKEIKDFPENDYILNPARFLVKPSLENGIAFEELVTTITRGAALNAKELDELNSEEETPYRYIKVANIKNGIIDYNTDVQYLKNIPTKYQKYCLKQNSIVLSKMGKPNLKSAVVHIEEGITLLPSTNLLIIEVNEKRADPNFIQAFFASEKATESLVNLITGSIIPIISAEGLKKMLIPNMILQEQHEIAKEYAKSLEEIKNLQTKLEEAHLNMNSLFNKTT